MSEKKVKNKIEEKEEIKEESKEEIPIEKKTLSGFDMNDYVATPQESDIQIHREISTIPAKKPNDQQFFRTHPSLAVLVNLFEWKEENDLYLVKQIGRAHV